MQKLVFELDIKRDIKFVFENMYRDEIYRTWASAFSKDGHYEGEIKEGAEIRFLDADNNGIGGKVGRIVPNEYLEFLMTYEIFSGEPKTIEEPGAETYSFSKIDENTTHIIVKTDVPEDYVEMMTDMWNIAIKSIISTLESV